MTVKALQNWLSPILDPVSCVAVPQPLQYQSADELLKTLERQLQEFSRQGLAGDKRSLLHGQGLDFADLRQYFPGDDIRKIDWNVFARTGEPHVKEYQDEKRLTLWVYLDLSPSMFFGARKTKATLALEIAGLLAILAQSGGHALGAFIHTESASKIIAPKAGLGHVQNVLNTAFELSKQNEWTRSKKPSDTPRLQQGFQEFSQMLKTHGLVFILSDFIDVTNDWESDWGRLARKASLYSAVMLDPHELNLTDDTGLIEVFDPESRLIKSIDWQNPALRKAYQTRVKHYQKQLSLTLGKFSKTCAAKTTEEPITSLLTLLQSKGGVRHGSR